MSVNDQELTEWFDGKTTVPGQVGVYRRRFKSPGTLACVQRYSHWDGAKWNGLWWSPEEAAIAYREFPEMKSTYQNLDWQGFLDEHKYIPKVRYE